MSTARVMPRESRSSRTARAFAANPACRKPTGAVARPVGRDGVEGGQPSGDELPVGGRTWLSVQQDQLAYA